MNDIFDSFTMIKCSRTYVNLTQIVVTLNICAMFYRLRRMWCNDCDFDKLLKQQINLSLLRFLMHDNRT